MFENFFIKSSGFYLSKFNNSSKIQDFLMWPLATRILEKKYEKIVKLKNGLLMKTDLKDVLGRFVIFYGPYLDYFWEPQTIKLMELLLKNSREAIIAGSHIGYLSLMARKAMSKEARVHSFEPVSYLYEISETNFRLNKELGEMTINKEALSDHSGEALVNIDNIKSAIVDFPAEGAETEKVKTITVDSYLKQANIKKLDFALFDVEGHEPAVFRGMNECFKKGQPEDIIFEYNPLIKLIKDETDDFREIKNILYGSGYKFYRIKDNYELKNIRKEWDKIEIVAFDEEKKGTDSQRYFNILATKRPEGELKQLLCAR